MESQGLVYPTTTLYDGREVPYWFEDAAYVLDEWEVEHLEDVTERLHGMCVEAAHHLVTGAYGTLGLSERALAAAQESLAGDPISLYGRFDLRYDGEGPAQLYEYNADTPTSIFEAAVFQWKWLEQAIERRIIPSHADQFNSIHPRRDSVSPLCASQFIRAKAPT